MRLKQIVKQLIGLMSLSAGIGLCLGFGIGLLVLLYGSRMNPWLALLLCPTSIVGLGLDNAPFIIGIVVVGSMVLIGNAIWYGFLFGHGGVVLKRISARSVGSVR